MSKKRILILATGGTIACVETPKGFVPGMVAEELADTVPELREIAEIETRQLMNIDSSDMRPHDWKTIARSVSAALQGQAFDGVVVTHGTDTMCYTASALSFMLPDPSYPIILTGAQTPLSVEGSDAPSNLIEACVAAASDYKGVAIAFNHKLIHGPRAFKMYSKNYDAYVSRNYPVVGVFEDNQLIIKKRPKFTPSKKKLRTSLCEDVFLLKVAPSTNPDIIEFVAAADYRGLVIEGFGTGGISNLGRGMNSAIAHLINEKGIPALMISQCPYDGVNLAVYGIGEQANALGIIPGNDMTTEAAMVKMMVGLAEYPGNSELFRQFMTANVCDEISSEIAPPPFD